MIDPHVVLLRYRLITEENVRFVDPPLLTKSTSLFDLILSDNLLTVMLNIHCSTVKDARELIDDYLRGWEIHIGLHSGTEYLRFEYLDAEVIDRCPSTEINRIATASGHASLDGITASGIAICVHELSSYPAPPSDFSANSMVKFLWNRYRTYFKGYDLLTTMGYVCLSAIQRDAGGRQKAAKLHCIDLDVLNKLGMLTSDVGDEMTARKFDDKSLNRVHTPAEHLWIETTVRKLIIRLGERASNSSALLSQITMADLPPL